MSFPPLLDLLGINFELCKSGKQAFLCKAALMCGTYGDEDCQLRHFDGGYCLGLDLFYMMSLWKSSQWLY